MEEDKDFCVGSEAKEPWLFSDMLATEPELEGIYQNLGADKHTSGDGKKIPFVKIQRGSDTFKLSLWNTISKQKGDIRKWSKIQIKKTNGRKIAIADASTFQELVN